MFTDSRRFGHGFAGFSGFPERMDHRLRRWSPIPEEDTD
jgi:hypothetical protein